MRCAFAVLVTLVGSLALADEKKAAEAPPAPPPEVKKTTDTFTGKWVGEATVDMGDGKPEKIKTAFDCKKVALGAGVSCSMAAKGSMGPMEQNCLVGFDPEGTGVHLMCITSMGEVHDHKGKWSDDKTVTFDSLTADMGGKSATEDLTIAFADPKTMTVTSITTQGDTKLTFTFSGKKK